VLPIPDQTCQGAGNTTNPRERYHFIPPIYFKVITLVVEEEKAENQINHEKRKDFTRQFVFWVVRTNYYFEKGFIFGSFTGCSTAKTIHL